jgi:hypothetical protein
MGNGWIVAIQPFFQQFLRYGPGQFPYAAARTDPGSTARVSEVSSPTALSFALVRVNDHSKLRRAAGRI